MKLFIPGPVNVEADVLKMMSSPMISHRSKSASCLSESISKNMQTLWNTENAILLSTSSGSALMEAAVKSLILKKGAFFSLGAFGQRWYEMAITNGKDADLYEAQMGYCNSPEFIDEILSKGDYDFVAITHNETSTGVTNNLDKIAEIIKKYDDIIFAVDAVSSTGGVNIDVDRCKIDICITSSQKCLGLPPGLAICSISEKAVNKTRQVKNRGYYLDLLNLYEYSSKKNYQYPATPSLSHMVALDYKLDKIMNQEGLENRYKRHTELATRTRQWALDNFELFVKCNQYSDTVTSIINSRNIDLTDLSKRLYDKGYVFSNGYGLLKGNTFRIAHMADTTLDELNEYLDTIDSLINA